MHRNVPDHHCGSRTDLDTIPYSSVGERDECPVVSIAFHDVSKRILFMKDHGILWK
jgi:hypothetical protein